MRDVPFQTLRVLRHALELSIFTTPELAARSGASYETVKKVLRSEQGSTMIKTGEQAGSGPGRPADVWKVTQPEKIATRLADVADELREASEVALSTPQDPVFSEADRRVELAEDYVVFALQSADAEDISALARRALATLRRAAGASPVEDEDGASNGGDRRASVTDQRATVVATMARYLASAEATGFLGPLWRDAFDSVRNANARGSDALHKRMLVSLVCMAVDRTRLDQSVRELPVPAVADLALAAACEPGGALDDLVATVAADSASARDHMQRALAMLLQAVASGSRLVEHEPLTRIVNVTSRVFMPFASVAPREAERATNSLCTLATAADADVARCAQDALIVLGQPRDKEFWLSLEEGSRVEPNLQVILRGISQTDSDAAFAHLRERLSLGLPADDGLQALRALLPSLEARAGAVAREQFADFLASVTNARTRARLALAPVLAGLDWPGLGLEGRVLRKLVTDVSRWRGLNAGAAGDPEIARRTATLARQIEERATEAFPLLTSSEQQRACDALTADLDSAAGRRLAVRSLLAAGRAHELAKRVVPRRPRHSDRGGFLTEWYLDAAKAAKLTPRERKALVGALYAAVPAYEAFAFLTRLVDSSPAAELPEISDNADFDLALRVQLATRGMQTRYRGAAERLLSVAAHPDDALLTGS